MARLLDGRYKGCDKVILVCDNLNTHTKGAFYEAFPPAQAREKSNRYATKLPPGKRLATNDNGASSGTSRSPTLAQNYGPFTLKFKV